MGKPISQRLIAAGLLATAVAMGSQVFLHFNPGALSPDSLSILAQARSGIFEDGHPPLMAAIWRLVDRVVPGPIGMLLLNLCLFYGGLYLIFRWAAPRYQLGVLPAFLVVGLFPPIIGILGVIWIDITMAGFFLVALGIFLDGSARPQKGLRIIFLLVALLLATLAMAVRHNGAAGAFPLIALFLLQSVRSEVKPLTRLAVATIGGLVVTLLLFLGTKQVSTWSVDVHRHFWRVAAMYDIAGTSYQENAYLFYPDVIEDNSLDNVRKLYSPRSLTPLLLGQQVHALPLQRMEKGKPIEFNLSNPSLNQRLLSNWMDVIVNHSTAYLTHRCDVFASLVTRSPWGLWGPVFDAVYPNDLGIAERPAKDSAYFAYIKLLALQSLIFVPLLYLILSAFAVLPVLVFGLRFQNQTLLVASALYGSGLAHMAGLFFLAASADFRYSHWMITTTVLATSLVVLELVRATRR